MLSIGGPLCSAQPQPSWKRMTRPGLWPCMPVLLAHVLRQTADYLLRTGGHCPTRHDSRKREGGFCKKTKRRRVREAGLLPPPALRTGREGFPSSSSSISKARVEDPSVVIIPAGCTILHRSRCPHGEGSTSGTPPPTFATPSIPIPRLFSCRDTAGKSARFRAG
jgi:hypothetical protein